MKVHAEIQYDAGGKSVHSDICPHGCNLKNMDKEYREFLHICLDEWLSKSEGTGMFYIKNEDQKID